MEIADDIPAVAAVEDNEDDGTLPKRRSKGKDRWISPAWLIGLIVYVVVVGLAFFAMPAEIAAGYAGAVILSSLLFLGGLQTVYRARRGLSRIPAAVGHILVIVGALGVVYDGAIDVYCLATGRLPPGRNSVASPQIAPENALVPQVQGARGPRQAGATDNAVRRRIQADRLERALADVRGNDRIKWGGACIMLSTLEPEEHQAEIATRLEGFLSDSDTFLVAFATSALEKWGTMDSIPKLEKLLTNKDAGLRMRAKRVIDAIRGRN